MTQGIITRAHRMNSKFGGYVHKCTIICTDGVERTLWADPKMVNWQHWEEIVEAMEMDIMRGRGIVLDNLKILKKNDARLDADVRPETLEIVNLEN